MTYKISDLAKLAGISTRTLRYYDQIGLLKPKRELESNYRFYDSDDVDKLQQILLFKEMSIELQEIQKMMKIMNKVERIKMLNHHLELLNLRKVKLDKLILNVKSTIKALKGEITMSDKVKFEGLKEQLIQENDYKYKTEVIANWGNEAYESSHKHFKNMSEEQFKHFNDLATKIIVTLKEIKNNSQDETLKQGVAELHKEWISMAWGFYDRDIHLKVVEMYVLDNRFKEYYDMHGDGLAQILKDSVNQYI